MRDFTTEIADVARRVEEARTYLNISVLRERLAELETEIAKPD
ncbi:MAG: peptide chain release factor 2, partial [Actinobacteria bacterium]|nr:peptide chain release factor 2 [Actinomycetota bacterium]